jgi:hypothetical protein
MGRVAAVADQRAQVMQVAFGELGHDLGRM